ncbi:MAG: hypothetical protein PHU25_17010 [Deltaproteobacteria bacterium]|nr:hypothetical protein [Deltaproteobacteria bacterium]
MMGRIGYRLPFALLFALGLFMIAQYYVPHPAVQGAKSLFVEWKQPMNAFIIFSALLGLVSMHARKVRRRERRYGYSIVTLVSMAAMTFAGLVFGIEDGTVFADWFEYLVTPIEATIFAMLAFYIASAAFRAFRARTAAAGVLLASALVVLLGLVPGMERLCPPLCGLADFLLQYPNTAAKRAIMIGVALGSISVALKTILGIDRTVLGKEA